jgi:tRNA dimethylallyltransferase
MSLPHPILIICGPTATGKTSLALQLANHFNGEIISCDSRQVYKHMDVVTGKDIPTKFKFNNSKLKTVGLSIGYYTDGLTKIWGLDMVKPDQKFHVRLYLEFIARIVPQLWQQNKLPVIVGGTGMYLKSISHPPKTLGIPIDIKLRKKIEKDSTKQLQNMLKKLNLAKYKQLNASDRQNSRRLIRAIEVSQNSSSIISLGPEYLEYTRSLASADFLWIGLNYKNRQHLYRQIDKRVLDRLSSARLITELNFLLKKNYLPFSPSTTIGYQQLITWMGGEYNFSELVEKWQFAEHSYARKQITWFKKQPMIHWFDPTAKVFNENVVNLVTLWYSGKNKHNPNAKS